MSEYLKAEDILGADDLPSEDVETPEWGGKVRVRGLTGTERDRFEFRLAAAKDNPEDVRVRAELVGRCIIDPADGSRLFTDKQLVKLGEKSATALDRCFDTVRELSGMGKDAVDRHVEDFSDAPSDGSSTG